MTREIKSVAVLGGGTMGSGIVGACAQMGCEVLLLDVDMSTAEKALDRILNGRPPALDDADKAHLIKLGTLSDDLEVDGIAAGLPNIRAFMEALTDHNYADFESLAPDSVPSGLPLP